MLPWYMGSMLLHRTTRLSLLYNNHQILRCILVKCLKACMLLRYLHYTKFAYQKNLIQALQNIFCKSIRKYRMLKKVKTENHCKPFTKSFFNSSFLICNPYDLTICFFAPARAFKPLPTICPEAASLHAHFHSRKDPYWFHRYLNF